MLGRKTIFIVIGLIFSAILLYFLLQPNTSKNTPFDYTLVLVGDSMTEYLGNFDELRVYLNNYFPNKKFLLLNYGFSSTNILSVPDRLEKLSRHADRDFQPVNDIPFQLIFIESFGYNPLSELPLDEGLTKQTQTLDKIIHTLSQKHPKSTIVFIATIAPNKDHFGGGVLNLLPHQKEQWVNERISYIKNHTDYAKSHDIPVIDIYAQSLNEQGLGNLDYINSNDFIHPSPTGIHFISKQIAEFIQKNKLLQ